MGKKRKARKIREDKGVAYVNKDYSKITDTPQEGVGKYPSTHLMVDNIATAKKGEYKVNNVSDLKNKSAVRFQDKYYWSMSIFLSFINLDIW